MWRRSRRHRRRRTGLAAALGFVVCNALRLGGCATLEGECGLVALGFDLDEQALAQIAGTDAERIEPMDDPAGFGDRGEAGFEGLRSAGVEAALEGDGLGGGEGFGERGGELFVGGGEVAVLVQVADDDLGCRANGLGEVERAELPDEVVGEGAGLERKCSNEGLSESSKLDAVLKPGIEVILEVAAEVDLVEGVFLDALCFR